MRMPTLIVISLLAIFPVGASNNNPVTQAIITTGITKSAQPITDNLSIVDSAIGYVTFYTELNGLNGKTIEHQWFYNQQKISSITMAISSEQSINWSQSSILPSQLGDWEVRVVDQTGNILAARRFSVVESRGGVRRAIQQQSIDSCQVKLEDLRKKAEENPDVDYYKFLHKKQATRCK